MCQNREQAAALTAIEIVRRCSRGEMFTAYDITLAVREEGVQVPHRDVRAVVHRTFAQGLFPEEYARTLCDVGGDRGPAWIYHRPCDDPTWFVSHRYLENMMTR
jgi:hypothetical protein